MPGEETEEQGEEIAGLEVLVSVPGGVMRGVNFISETFRKSSIELRCADKLSPSLGLMLRTQDSGIFFLKLVYWRL